MSNPAFRRSGDTGNPVSSRDEEADLSAPGALAAHPTTELIALRDRLLAECLDIESRISGREGTGADLPDPGPIRERIDEIHQELALRDLAERVNVDTSRTEPVPPPAVEAEGRLPPAQAARKSIQILEAIEMRSRFMDELAQAARAQGRLDQAAAFTLNAQKLDMQRVEVLRQLNALSLTAADTAETAI